MASMFFRGQLDSHAISVTEISVSPLHMLIDNGGLFSYVEYYEIPLDAREQ